MPVIASTTPTRLPQKLGPLAANALRVIGAAGFSVLWAASLVGFGTFLIARLSHHA